MAFYRASIGGGGGSGWTLVEAVSQVPSGVGTFTIGQSLTVGKTYHIFMTNSGGNVNTANNVASISGSSGVSNLTEISKVNGFYGSGNYYSSMIHYSFEATAQTVVFSKYNNTVRPGYILLVE